MNDCKGKSKSIFNSTTSDLLSLLFGKSNSFRIRSIQERELMTGSKQLPSKQLIDGTVLLIAADDVVGHSLQHALEAATIAVEWAKSLGDLRDTAARDDRSALKLLFLDLDLPGAPAEVLVPVARNGFPHATTIALAGEVSGE